MLARPVPLQGNERRLVLVSCQQAHLRLVSVVLMMMMFEVLEVHLAMFQLKHCDSERCESTDPAETVVAA